MNDELRDRLMGYLENMEKAVEGGADFVIQQAPLYVQEVIRWEIAYNFIWGYLLAWSCICDPISPWKAGKEVKGKWKR